MASIPKYSELPLRYKKGMPTYLVGVAMGSPVYATDYMTKKKEAIGRDYVYFAFESKKQAIRFAYRNAKITIQTQVQIWAANKQTGRYYNWGTVLYTNNPRAFYYNKVIIHSMDNTGGWNQLRYDGTIGKLIRKGI